MAEDNTSKVRRAEINGVEYYTVAATGESGVSQRGLARACGKALSTIQKLVENLTDGKAPDDLKAFLGMDLSLTDEAISQLEFDLNF